MVLSCCIKNMFTYAVGLRMVDDAKWEQLFGFKRRDDEDSIEQYHCNLGLAIQQVTEEIVLKMAQHARDITGCKTLVYGRWGSTKLCGQQ